jgi:hypothetical protein
MHRCLARFKSEAGEITGPDEEREVCQLEEEVRNGCYGALLGSLSAAAAEMIDDKIKKSEATPTLPRDEYKTFIMEMAVEQKRSSQGKRAFSLEAIVNHIYKQYLRENNMSSDHICSLKTNYKKSSLPGGRLSRTTCLSIDYSAS